MNTPGKETGAIKKSSSGSVPKKPAATVSRTETNPGEAMKKYCSVHHHDSPASSSTSVPKTPPTANSTEEAVRSVESDLKSKHVEEIIKKGLDEALEEGADTIKIQFTLYHPEFKPSSSGSVPGNQKGKGKAIKKYCCVHHHESTPSSSGSVPKTPPATNSTEKAVHSVSEVASDSDSKLESDSFEQAEENRRPILSHHDSPASSSASVPRTTPATSSTQRAVYSNSDNDSGKTSSDKEVISSLFEIGDDQQRLYITVTGSLSPRGDAEGDATHEGVVCDACYGSVRGYLYKCVQCQDFDLCATCEGHGNHPEHVMMRIPYPLALKQSRRVSHHLKKKYAENMEDIENPAVAVVITELESKNDSVKNVKENPRKIMSIHMPNLEEVIPLRQHNCTRRLTNSKSTSSRKGKETGVMKKPTSESDREILAYDAITKTVYVLIIMCILNIVSEVIKFL